ncbi:MAG: recombinase family protein [Solirubrobacteraceae bacterium]
MARLAVAYLRSPGGHKLDRARVPRGLELVAVVRDADPSVRGRLREALEHITAGRADTLFLPRLRAAAGCLAELTRLIEWLEDAGADLVAADVGLDTSSRTGASSVALLREVEAWAREPERPRGRPGLSALSPVLARRIATMRESGLSLQAIADTLNGEAVPTPRGGARWRPSSVQSALGYRRPRPPAPGTPHRPPGPGGPRPGAPYRPPGRRAPGHAERPQPDPPALGRPRP